MIFFNIDVDLAADQLSRYQPETFDWVSDQCDGKDYTEKIREKKIHVILFLNIKSYGAGTNPWGSHVSRKLSLCSFAAYVLYNTM